LEEVHQSFEGFAALLLDWDFTGDRSQPPAFSIGSYDLRGSVTMRLDADLAQ
jgi:hypothetical protein